MVEQVGTAQELYEQPATRFVATFVGRASVLPGVATGDGRVRVGESAVWPADARHGVADGQHVSVVVRPEALRFVDGGGLTGTVTECRYTGARAFFLVGATGDLFVEVEAPVEAARVGDTVHVEAGQTRIYPESV
jgi:ABC-type Fe3+/spermidine/putrescine transport system ATPase subunit